MEEFLKTIAEICEEEFEDSGIYILFGFFIYSLSLVAAGYYYSKRKLKKAQARNYNRPNVQN